MTEKKYSRTIAQTINGYLTGNEWHFSFDENRGLFKFGLSLKGKIKKINYLIDVKEGEYVVYAISPIGADEDDKEMMASMAEFVCRANYGLANGSFELDMRDGEIRFKCFVDCVGITPTREMVRNSIHCPAAMFEHYGAGIVDIILGNATAKDAVEECKKSAKEEFRFLVREILFGEECRELDDVDIAARLIELAEGDSELADKLSRLIEIAEGMEPLDNEEPTDTACEPVQIKTDLFRTEGADA